MSELHDLLERATDLIESPDLASTALASARRRRTTYRTALAVGGAAALVVVVALVSGLNGRDDSTPPVTPSPTTSTAPTTTKEATSLLAEVAQPPWDPRHVDELPAAGSGVASAVPDVVNVPATASPLADDPVDAAVMIMRGETAIMLLAADGSWRSAPLPSAGQYGAMSLSPDGTRLGVETDSGVDVWDLPTGERTSVAYPNGYRASDFTTWMWVDMSTLLFEDSDPGGWLVDWPTGLTTRVPYPEETFAATVDNDGGLVESQYFARPALFIDWAGGTRRQVDQPWRGEFVSVRANADSVAGVTGQSIVVADRADLTPRHMLPIDDPEDNYGSGKLGVVALLDDGTVLLQVPVFRPDISWRLVAWDPESGDLTRVARGNTSVPASYATGLLN